MRNEMKIILKEEFRTLALRTRDNLGLTQDKMSEKLGISERAYSNIENGKSTCGTLTAMMLLMYTDNSIMFIQNMQARFEEIGAKEK